MAYIRCSVGENLSFPIKDELEGHTVKITVSGWDGNYDVRYVKGYFDDVQVFSEGIGDGAGDRVFKSNNTVSRVNGGYDLGFWIDCRRTYFVVKIMLNGGELTRGTSSPVSCVIS